LLQALVCEPAQAHGDETPGHYAVSLFNRSSKEARAKAGRASARSKSHHVLSEEDREKAAATKARKRAERKGEKAAVFTPHAEDEESVRVGFEEIDRGEGVTLTPEQLDQWELPVPALALEAKR